MNYARISGSALSKLNFLPLDNMKCDGYFFSMTARLFNISLNSERNSKKKSQQNITLQTYNLSSTAKSLKQ